MTTHVRGRSCDLIFFPQAWYASCIVFVRAGKAAARGWSSERGRIGRDERPIPRDRSLRLSIRCKGRMGMDGRERFWVAEVRCTRACLLSRIPVGVRGRRVLGHPSLAMASFPRFRPCDSSSLHGSVSRVVPFRSLPRGSGRVAPSRAGRLAFFSSSRGRARVRARPSPPRSPPNRVPARGGGVVGRVHDPPRMSTVGWIRPGGSLVRWRVSFGMGVGRRTFVPTRNLFLRRRSGGGGWRWPWIVSPPTPPLPSLWSPPFSKGRGGATKPLPGHVSGKRGRGEETWTSIGWKGSHPEHERCSGRVQVLGGWKGRHQGQPEERWGAKGTGPRTQAGTGPGSRKNPSFPRPVRGTRTDDRTIRSRGGRTELTLETNGTRCRQAGRDETRRTRKARSAQGSPGAREAGAEGKGERGAPRGQDETDPARTREAPRKGGQGTPRERGAQAARPAGLSPALSDGRRTCFAGTKLQKRRPGPLQEQS
eukprot:scaffold2639_cov361-Pavlova_lutheri.AAC.67